MKEILERMRLEEEVADVLIHNNDNATVGKALKTAKKVLEAVDRFHVGTANDESLVPPAPIKLYRQAPQLSQNGRQADNVTGFYSDVEGWRGYYGTARLVDNEWVLTHTPDWIKVYPHGLRGLDKIEDFLLRCAGAYKAQQAREAEEPPQPWVDPRPAQAGELKNRLLNWKFAQATRYLAGQSEEVDRAVRWLAAQYYNMGWPDNGEELQYAHVAAVVAALIGADPHGPGRRP